MYIHYIMSDDAPKPTIEELAQVPGTCASFNLRRADRIVTQLYAEMLRPVGIKPTQFTLLTAIRLRGPVTINGLAEGLVMDRTTLTRNLKPLEKAGLVVIHPGRDRRVREVMLTGEGRRTLERAYPLWRKAQALIADRLGEERLSHMLGDLAATVQAIRD
ncbi:MAG: MarR family winged helix-turn-helix transcriptional regulator [Acidobacteriota bacterium]